MNKKVIYLSYYYINDICAPYTTAPPPPPANRTSYIKIANGPTKESNSDIMGGEGRSLGGTRKRG